MFSSYLQAQKEVSNHSGYLHFLKQKYCEKIMRTIDSEDV